MLGACGQITGLDAAPSPNDGNPLIATFAVDAVYFGATLYTVPLELDSSKIKALVADAASAGGFRELPVTTVGATAQCDFPAGAEGLWQWTAPSRFGSAVRVYPITDATRQWHAVVTTPGNPNASAPPANATVDVSTTLTQVAQPFDRFSLFVAGPWVEHTFFDEENETLTYDPVAILYSFVNPFAGPTRYTITRNDRAYIMRYNLPQLVSVAKVAPFDLKSGVNALSGTQVPVVTNLSLNATLDTESVRNRLQPQITSGAILLNNYWRIVASPKGPYPFFWGALLTAGAPAPTLRVTYGNPFFEDGLSPTMFWVTSTSRTERDADGTVWTHDTGFQIEDTKPSGDRSYVADSGLPISISLNGNILNSDKIAIAVDNARPIELSFAADRMDGEWRSLDCYRFDLKPARETLVLSVRLLTDRILIPSSLLTRGARYKCRMHLIRGSPKALQGDDREREAMIRFGYIDSSSFIVR